MTWVPRLNRNIYEALRHFLSPVRSWEWWIFPGDILMLLFIHCNHWPELMLEKAVIMNRNSRNKPEMLWMETFFAKHFWKRDCLEVDSVLSESPSLSPSTLGLQFGCPNTSLNTQPRCCLLQRSLGGSLMYSLWTLASLLQNLPHESVSSTSTGVSLDTHCRAWQRYSVHRSIFPFIRWLWQPEMLLK